MNNKQTNTSRAATGATYRPTLAFFHANAKGTGSALRLEIVPAQSRSDGAIMASFANQSTIGERNAPTPVYPRFDWENKITIKLNFSDLCEILQVLRGEKESAAEGKGFFHQSASGSSRIGFKHVLDPVSGYLFDVSRTSSDGSGVSSRFFFSPAEATGLECVVSGSMALIAFGVAASNLGVSDKRDSGHEKTDSRAA